MKVLVVIPARGGSKGIPRKSIKNLGGKPLIYYAINNAKSLDADVDIVVSTDDEEIGTLSKKLGAEVVNRPKSLAEDSATLDGVIFDALIQSEKKKSLEYDIVVTLQPTSPLLKPETLNNALNSFVEKKLETLISCVGRVGLSWRKEGDKFVPNYKERLNRQYLPKHFDETGAFVFSKREFVTETSRFGNHIELFETSEKESIDIDTFEEWSLCEYYLNRKTILFVVSGYPAIGLGHVYNCLQLAEDIWQHRVMFLVDKKSQFAFDKIASSNYQVFMQESSDIVDDINRLGPDIVINDILDTKAEYIKALKENNYCVINFEDLGEGTQYADAVINAIYPERTCEQNHYFGQNYFCLRHEFLLSDPVTINKDVKNILVTFGGTDPNNYTQKVLRAIVPTCEKLNIKISVVAGLGYDKYETLKEFKNVDIQENVQNISDFMSEADIIFTAAGRTAFEIAALGVPSIILAQSKRGLTHFFASEKYGFINLGLGFELDDEDLTDRFEKLIENYDERLNMHKTMLSHDLRLGRKRVMQVLKSVWENISEEV